MAEGVNRNHKMGLFEGYLGNMNDAILSNFARQDFLTRIPPDNPLFQHFTTMDRNMNIPSIYNDIQPSLTTAARQCLSEQLIIEIEKTEYLPSMADLYDKKKSLFEIFPSEPLQAVNSNLNFTEIKSKPASNSLISSTSSKCKNPRKMSQVSSPAKSPFTSPRSKHFQKDIVFPHDSTSDDSEKVQTIKKRKSFLSRMKNLFTTSPKKENLHNKSCVGKDWSKSQQFYPGIEETKTFRYSFRSLSKKQKAEVQQRDFIKNYHQKRIPDYHGSMPVIAKSPGTRRVHCQSNCSTVSSPRTSSHVTYSKKSLPSSLYKNV